MKACSCDPILFASPPRLMDSIHFPVAPSSTEATTGRFACSAISVRTRPYSIRRFSVRTRGPEFDVRVPERPRSVVGKEGDDPETEQKPRTNTPPTRTNANAEKATPRPTQPAAGGRRAGAPSARPSQPSRRKRGTENQAHKPAGPGRPDGRDGGRGVLRTRLPLSPLNALGIGRRVSQTASPLETADPVQQSRPQVPDHDRTGPDGHRKFIPRDCRRRQFIRRWAAHLNL